MWQAVRLANRNPWRPSCYARGCLQNEYESSRTPAALVSSIINSLNGVALVLLFIGIPASTRVTAFHYAVSATPTIEMLTLCGLGIAVGLNLLGGWRLVKSKKFKRLCFSWSAVHGALLLLVSLMAAGVIEFRWLKEALLWLRGVSRGSGG